MAATAASLASPLTTTASAAALAAAALASRKSDPAVRGRMMVMRSLKAAITAPPLAAPAPLAGASSGLAPTPMAPLRVGMCSEPRPATSVLSAEELKMAPCPGAGVSALDDAALGHAPSAAISTPPSALPSGSGSCAACFSATSTSPVLPKSPRPVAANATGSKGREEELVKPRHSLRRMDFASSAMKTRPRPPAWLHGRCHRCHEIGHWASFCREQLRCNNCRRFGHKAKCCTGRTAPRPPLVQDRHGSHPSATFRPCPWQQGSPLGPQQQPKLPREPADLRMQSVLPEQAELLCSELRGCLARVESFLVRAEDALGRLKVALDVSPPSELHVNSTDDVEACLFGEFSPRAMPFLSPQPVVPTAAESKDTSRVTSVIQIMSELQELSEEPASSKVGLVGASLVAPVSEIMPVMQIMPELRDLCVEPFAVFPTEVVSLSDEVSKAGAVAPDDLFAKEVCDLLISLEAACPGSGKEIATILMGKASKDIIKKVKKSLRRKCK